MDKEVFLHETSKYRCLVYPERISNELYLITCGVEHCLPDYSYYESDRAGYHFHVILEGKGTLNVRGKEHRLHFGQMFMTKPGEDAVYKADHDYPWTYCWMAFDGNIARESVEKAGFFDGVNFLDCHVDHQIFYSLVERALNHVELTNSGLYTHTGLLLEFLGQAIQSYNNSELNARKPHEYQTNLYVEYAVNFIGANYATAKVSDVANHIGIHRSYLMRIFKKKMGISPQEYLMQCRLKQACKLLAETDNPIQEIGRNVGYDNQMTFSRTFKLYYGVSPSAYRLQHQKDKEKGSNT